MRNKQVLLASRPKGQVQESDFRLVESETQAPREGQVLARVLYLSLDPYMRGRMDDARSYAQPQPVGEVMVGGTVAEVVESKDPGLRKGDLVTGMGGWQQFHVADAKALRKIDVSLAPPSAYLGVLGMPGVTAWYGLMQIGKPKAGETVVVSAAAGAVGSVVGQIAKIAGCRAIGVAGGPAKCEHVVRDLFVFQSMQRGNEQIDPLQDDYDFWREEIFEQPGFPKMYFIEKRYAGLTAMDRIGRPEEAAEAALWLSSDAASYVTGHSMIVDGGYTASTR